MRTTQKPDIKTLFEILFSPEQIILEYGRRHSESNSRGLDRRTGRSFRAFLAFESDIVSEKCLSGEYKFTPYLEKLKIKDAKSFPRKISIPSIRDRLVLSQLNKILRISFRKESASPLASNYVRRLANELEELPLDSTWTAGCDIKKFYDSIDRTRLLKILAVRLSETPCLALIKKAIETPTVPQNYRSRETRIYHDTKGVPQGLAISNALAAIYLSEVDKAMSRMPIKYFRFVDDILLIGSRDETAKAQRSFAARVRARSLSVHKLGDKKSHHLPLSAPFSYLGYVFKMPKISVRESTVERLLHSFASKISDYKYNRHQAIGRKSYLTEDTFREIFIEELNEKISGAISGDRRYGWVAYFSEINDLTVLHRIDKA